MSYLAEHMPANELLPEWQIEKTRILKRRKKNSKKFLVKYKY